MSEDQFDGWDRIEQRRVCGVLLNISLFALGFFLGAVFVVEFIH